MDSVSCDGRRIHIERRQFSYILHVPERRSGKDRRSGFDRRSALIQVRQTSSERRVVL